MSLSDNQLIQNAQKGDMAAFERLVYKYDRHVLNMAKSFRNSDDDAKDIYQEVFIRVYRGLKSFQFKSEFSTWLYRITANVCITYQNKRKQHDSIDREIGIDDEDRTTFADQLPGELRTDDSAVGSDLSKHINRALETLPPQQKMAFTLKYYQDYKIKEIADIMQCNEGTIKRYLFTATNKMRERLKGIR
ncbi:MAG: RNA polymerase sigma factor [Melioribacteraceae bacterium]|nr:RNA polymerase sigma factor [Melioribacteraceae bacterium]